MFNKRIGLCALVENEGQTMVTFCEDNIFTENVAAKINAQGSVEGFLADILMNDSIYNLWAIRLQQIRDDNPMLWVLMLNEADYWTNRFQDLSDNLRGVV